MGVLRCQYRKNDSGDPRLSKEWLNHMELIRERWHLDIFLDQSSPIFPALCTGGGGGKRG